MSTQEATKIRTCDELVLSPIWRQKRHPASLPLPIGLTRETALVNAWMTQMGETCPNCGRHMTHRGAPIQKPTLVRLTVEGGDDLSNLTVICAGCAEG